MLLSFDLWTESSLSKPSIYKANQGTKVEQLIYFNKQTKSKTLPYNAVSLYPVIYFI